MITHYTYHNSDNNYNDNNNNYNYGCNDCYYSKYGDNDNDDESIMIVSDS